MAAGEGRVVTRETRLHSGMLAAFGDRLMAVESAEFLHEVRGCPLLRSPHEHMGKCEQRGATDEMLDTDRTLVRCEGRSRICAGKHGPAVWCQGYSAMLWQLSPT